MKVHVKSPQITYPVFAGDECILNVPSYKNVNTKHIRMKIKKAEVIMQSNSQSCNNKLPDGCIA